MKSGMRRFPFAILARVKNSIKTKDNLLFKKNLIRDWENGMQHEIPGKCHVYFVQVLQCDAYRKLYGSVGTPAR